MLALGRQQHSNKLHHLRRAAPQQQEGKGILFISNTRGNEAAENGKTGGRSAEGEGDWQKGREISRGDQRYTEETQVGESNSHPVGSTARGEPHRGSDVGRAVAVRKQVTEGRPAQRRRSGRECFILKG